MTVNGLARHSVARPPGCSPIPRRTRWRWRRCCGALPDLDVHARPLERYEEAIVHG